MLRFLATVFLVLCAAPAQAETISLVADRWCPYNCDAAAERPGFMVEIAKRAFARHGIAVEYSIMPWSRALAETRLGKHTAIIRANPNDEPDFIFPSLPQARKHCAFYVKKGNAWHYTDVDSLKTISLGAIDHYSYSPEIDAYIAAHRNELRYVQLLSGDEALALNVKKLLAGRVDAVVEDEHVMDYYLAKNGLDTQADQQGGLPFSGQNNLYIAFSPTDPNAKRYAQILSKEMQAMRDSGELQAILADYLILDWQK